MKAPETVWMESSRGPRRTVGIRLSGDVLLIVEAAAAQGGLSRNALLEQILERWAVRWAKTGEAETIR
jgi:hypothetical protein